MREVTRWIEENPYRALFGSSEQRLKGLVSDGWKSHWDPMSGRLKRTRENIEVLHQVVKGEVIDLDKDASKIVYKQTNAGKADVGVGNSPSKRQQTSQPVEHSNTSSASLNAGGYWSTHTPKNGSISEAFGKLRYDPITMRLVADESKDDVTEGQATADQWPRTVPVAQESVTFSTDVPATSATSQDKSEDASNLKEKLEKSFAQARKSIKTQSEEFNKTPIVISASNDMGAAWRKEQSVNVHATSRKTPETTSNLDGIFAQTKSSLESAWTSEKQNSRVSSSDNSNPHYLGQAKPQLGHEAQLASMSLKKKDKPLRHMRGWELGQHKASLLASWSKKGEAAKTDMSKEHLNNEVQRQKTAFASHEEKWRLRDAASTVAVAAADTFPVSKSSSVKATDSNKAGEKEDANCLVRDVREIYESAYGVIDTTHRQGEMKAASSTVNVGATNSRNSQKDVEAATQEAYLDDALSDYDRKMGSSGYDYKTGQDSLEEEVKNKGVSDALKPTAEEPKSKQYKLSDIVKKPDSTEMSSVNPIDGMTRPRTFAEYMDAQTFSPTGFSSPVNYQFLSETQPTVELEDNVKVSALASEVLESTAAANTSNEPNAPDVKSGSTGSTTDMAALSTLPSQPKPSARTPSKEADLESLRSPGNSKSLRWTPSEEALMKRLHSRGLSAEDLAGIRRLRRWTSQETATLQRLDRQGLTVRDVAMLSEKPAEWTKEETNQLTMVLAQNLPSAYRSAAKDVTELKTMYEKGLSSADVIATKRLSKWAPKELALLGRMSMSDIMILDKQRLATQSPSLTTEPATQSRVIRKQEPVFSGGSINATPSTDEPRINKRRKRSVKVAESPSDDVFASPTHKLANNDKASRYPSSFLHSTRTYMPTGSLFDSGSGDMNDGMPPSGNTGRSGGSEDGKRGGFQRKLKAAGYIAAACYATGLTIEYLRSGTPSSAHASTSAINEPTTSTPKASGESGNRKRTSELSTTEASPMAASAALSKEEDTYIEAVKKDYQRNAWGDELLSKRDTGPAISPVSSTPSVVATVAGTAQANDGMVDSRPFPVMKAGAHEGSDGGGMEGLAALGAGIVATVVVLLGGFGGSG